MFKDYFCKTLHRVQLDKKLYQALPLLTGLILDIGSKNRRYDFLLTSRPIALDLLANPALDILPGNVYALNFSDNYFDSVICLEVLEYVTDLELALSEIKRVMKKGGVGIISLPFIMSEHGDYVRYTKLFLNQKFSQHFSHIEISSLGNFYSLILDILRYKIQHTNFILSLILRLLWGIGLLLWPLFSDYTDQALASGYLIKVIK